MLNEKQLKLAEHIGNLVREAFPEEQTPTQSQRVLMWLGYWRDSLPTQAIRDLQEIIDPQK